MVASLIANKKKGQRSRGESISSAVSDVQSFASSTRFSRRSEIALQCHQEELALVDAILNILPLKLAEYVSEVEALFLRNILILNFS